MVTEGQGLAGMYSPLDCSEGLSLCGPAFILWSPYPVFVTAESGLTLPLWVQRNVLCSRDYRACRRRTLLWPHHQPIYICLYVHQSHSLSAGLFYCVAFYCSGLWHPAEPHQVTSRVKAAPFCCATTQKQGFQAQEWAQTPTRSSDVYACSTSFENSYCGLELG